MEALINLVTSSLLVLPCVLMCLMVRLFEMPTTHTKVLPVGVRHTWLAIAHQASWSVAKRVLASASVMVLAARCRHIERVTANDSTNGELLLIGAPLLVILRVE